MLITTSCDSLHQHREDANAEEGKLIQMVNWESTWTIGPDPLTGMNFTAALSHSMRTTGVCTVIYIFSRSCTRDYYYFYIDCKLLPYCPIYIYSLYKIQNTQNVKNTKITTINNCMDIFILYGCVQVMVAYKYTELQLDKVIFNVLCM